MSQTAFLLAFQEPISRRSNLNRESSEAAVALGTKTLTEVRGEAADKDRHEGSLFTIPAGDLQLGTMTKTAVRAETPDSDPGALGMTVLPSPASAFAVTTAN